MLFSYYESPGSRVVTGFLGLLTFFRTYARPIEIENNVWIGGGCILLPGVTIGENSVIGAGSVVTRPIPPNCVAVGNPCRVIRYFDTDREWWQHEVIGEL